MRKISLLVVTCASSLLFGASVVAANAQETSAPGALQGDAAAGELVFKKCMPCHSTAPNKMKVGPSLHGVVGRTPGTLAGYKYSPAMTAFGAGGAVWDKATIDSYLVAPRDVVPNTKMIFVGLPDAQTRAHLIAYLESLVAGGAAQ